MTICQHSLRLILFLTISALGLLLNGCQTTPPGVSLERNNPDIVTYNNTFLIVKSRQADTYRSLADRYYRDEHQAFRLASINPEITGQAGQLIAVPMVDSIPSNVGSGVLRTIPILCYHQFTKSEHSPHPLVLQASKFRQQLQYLMDNQYQVLDIKDLSSYLGGKKPIPDKAVIITIDDGYRSIYDVAYPMLKEFGYPATVFLYTDFIGGGAALTWTQIKKLKKEGLLSFQSHSKSHASLATLPDPDEDTIEFLRTEILTPHKKIGQKLGRDPIFFAYPYGDSSDMAVKILEDANYELAFTVQSGGNPVFADPMRLRRAMIYDSDTITSFQRKLANQENY